MFFFLCTQGGREGGKEGGSEGGREGGREWGALGEGHTIPHEDLEDKEVEVCFLHFFFTIPS